VAVKGLLLNFFEFAFPWTLRSRGFVKLLVAPVVRVVNSVGNVKEFLSERDFHSWSSLNSPNEWTPTRFGSIGSMNPLHMRDLFADRKKYSFAVTYNTPLDDVALALPYGPDIDARRKWLEDHRPETVLDYNTNSKAVPLREFVDRELAHVFYNEAARGLPSVIDGLTIAQRRALNCLLRLREG
jgi:DNA gyrase/topoisomerase IV subunit B